LIKTHIFAVLFIIPGCVFTSLENIQQSFKKQELFYASGVTTFLRQNSVKSNK